MKVSLQTIVFMIGVVAAVVLVGILLKKTLDSTIQYPPLSAVLVLR